MLELSLAMTVSPVCCLLRFSSCLTTRAAQNHR